VNNVLIKIGLGALIVGAVFGFLWWQGYLVRLTNYVTATREELRKCTWPTVEELKGSTTVVVIAIIILGAFTMASDSIILMLLSLITKAVV
jgi:preprotein translocase subunit SecE